MLINVYGGAPFQTQLILHGAGVAFLWLVISNMSRIQTWLAGVINPEAFYFKAAFYAILYIVAVIVLPTIGFEIYKRYAA